MPLPWELRRRGLKDSLRHDERVKEAIRKNLRDLIAEEAIITSDGAKKIKIPLRYLDQYRFKYGQPQQGIGQGEGEPGDVIGHQVGDSNQPGDGPAGDQPGEHTYEVDLPLEELTQMMMEDLALPWLEEKPERQITSTSHRFSDIRRKGSLANLDKRRTLLNNITRNAARGHAGIHNLHEDDLRFKTWDIQEEVHANAVVYMLMDCSGSMTSRKKYVAKSFFFWMVRFLRMKYRQVDTVFIVHDTRAQLVSEKDFFTISEGGGTCCSSAYLLAQESLKQHHPPGSWNVYLFHFSDGDNWPSDNDTCKDIVTQLLPQCSMVGYGEIRYGDDASFYGWVGGSTAPSSLQTVFNGINHPRFISVTIANKEDVHQALQQFLQPRENTHV